MLSPTAHPGRQDAAGGGRGFPSSPNGDRSRPCSGPTGPARPPPSNAPRACRSAPPEAGRLLGQDPDTGRAPGCGARVGVMLQDGGLPPSARPIPLLRHIAGMYQILAGRRRTHRTPRHRHVQPDLRAAALRRAEAAPRPTTPWSGTRKSSSWTNRAPAWTRNPAKWSSSSSPNCATAAWASS